MPKFETPQNNIPQEKEEYLKLRALERYKETGEASKNKMEDLLERWEDIAEDSKEMPEAINTEGLDEEIQELSQEMGEDRKKELEREGFKNLRKYMEKRKNYLQKEKNWRELYQDWLKKGFQKPNVSETTDFWLAANEIKENAENYEEKIEEASRENPESYLANGLLTLREYKKQLKESGIVETPYIKEKQKKIEESMINHGVVALVGETGTGKTKISKKISEKLTGESPEWVFGHADATKEDLLYHLGLQPEKEEAVDIPEQIEEAKKRYQEMHPEIPEEKREEALNQIEEIIKGQTSEKEMKTDVVLGPILKAAQEGKIVIIDEFNYIKPQLLASLNSLVEAKPNDTIKFMGKEIKVQEGFGIIFTGNINVAGAKRYLEREELDPAFVNRLNSGLIEYNTPPQEIKRNFEEVLPTDESKEDINNDLFRIGVTNLIDEKGNLKAPEDTLDKVWRLSRCFALLQKVYSGKNITEGDEEYFDSSKMGTGFNLDKYHASMRTFGAILQSWKEDGFESGIDYHIYNNLIRPASAISPQEAAQMLYILRSDYGNFLSENDPVWKKLKAKHQPEWNLEGRESLTDLEKEDIAEEAPDHYFTPKELVESITGQPMHKEAETTEEAKEAQSRSEKVEIVVEEEQKLEKIESLINEVKSTVDRFCEDESKIMS